MSRCLAFYLDIILDKRGIRTFSYSASSQDSCTSTSNRTKFPKFHFILLRVLFHRNYYSQHKLFVRFVVGSTRRKKFPPPESERGTSAFIATIHHSPLEMLLRWAVEGKNFIIKSLPIFIDPSSESDSNFSTPTRVLFWVCAEPTTSRNRSQHPQDISFPNVLTRQRFIVVVSLGLERESVPKKLFQRVKK